MPTRGQIKFRKKKSKELSETETQSSTSQEVAPAVQKQTSPPSNSTNKQDKLRYPIKDQNLYKGSIRFRVKELEPLQATAIANLNDIEQFGTNLLSRLDEKIGEANESANETAESKRQRSNEITTAKRNLNGVENNTYDNSRKQNKYAGSVTLYLPSSLQIIDAVQYNSASLGTIGAGVEAGMAKGGSALGAIAAGVTQGVESFTNLFSSAGVDKEAASLALNKVSALGGEEVAAGVKSATRVTVNPNLRTLLESVPIRNIPFTFKLVAQNEQESDEITRIIEFFRYQMYPDEITGTIGGASVSLGYKFPDPFEISATYDGVQVGTKFLDAYLSSVTVSYNEGGMGFHADGKPVDVNISLQFVEAKALSRNLVKLGY
jgi:hypothetical protein